MEFAGHHAPMKNTDVIVLGAGIVGVSVALHLARARVTLVDRRGPGEETSYGNAGLIERASVIPYAFPVTCAACCATP